MNPELTTARQLVETTSAHVFLTGRAGTGKTTFLRDFRRTSTKRIVVLAPTGIAAINAEGQTLHSFFQLPFGPFIPGYTNAVSEKVVKAKRKLIRSLDLLVIDEISMVRADLLDAVDSALRAFRRSSEPFGGVQLLMIGDLQQLSPVVRPNEWNILSKYYATPYFFSSQALARTTYYTIELKHVFRQSDPYFLQLLNNIRSGNADSDTLAALNKRCDPNFQPPQGSDYIRLVTHNYQAQTVNDQQLSQLPGKAYRFTANVKGRFPDNSYPTEPELVLKKGAQVMFLKNNREKGYFNGMIGKIESISQDGFSVSPYSAPEQLIDVEPEAWENTSYTLDSEGNITENVEGTFTQFPIKTAWAITIHKSQGLTFNHVLINASEAFAAGQTYVALSRCRTLEGIVLSAPISPRAIIADAAVTDFNDNISNKQIGPADIARLQLNYSLQLIDELFNLQPLRSYIFRLVQVMQGSTIYSSYPGAVHALEDYILQLDDQLIPVSKKFRIQYVAMLSQTGSQIDQPLIQERFRKAATYYANAIEELTTLVDDMRIEVDNKVTKKRFTEAFDQLLQEIFTKSILFQYVAQNGLLPDTYCPMRAQAILNSTDPSARRAWKRQHRKSIKAKEKESSQPQTSDIANKKLYNALRQWRVKKMEAEGVPAYIIAHNKVLISIANNQPASLAEMKKIPYITKRCLNEWAQELLSIVENNK